MSPIPLSDQRAASEAPLRWPRKSGQSLFILHFATTNVDACGLGWHGNHLSPLLIARERWIEFRAKLSCFKHSIHALPYSHAVRPRSGCRTLLRITDFKPAKLDRAFTPKFVRPWTTSEGSLNYRDQRRPKGSQSLFTSRAEAAQGRLRASPAFGLKGVLDSSFSSGIKVWPFFVGSLQCYAIVLKDCS